VGDAYDNARAESFFATLEREVLNRRRFKSQAEAEMAAFGSRLAVGLDPQGSMTGQSQD